MEGVVLSSICVTCSELDKYFWWGRLPGASRVSAWYADELLRMENRTGEIL